MKFLYNNYMLYLIIAIVVVLLIVLFVATTAGTLFLDTFNKYDLVKSERGINCQDFLGFLARTEPKLNSKVDICRVSGKLTDCYIPKKRLIALSESTINNDSVAALSVVAHEFGHAMQHSERSPLYMFSRILSFLNRVLGKFIIPLVVIGLVMLPFSSIRAYGYIVLYVGGGILALILLFKLITIPLEYNASRRGMIYLSKYKILNEKELKMARKVLDKAAMTYIADFLSIITGINILRRK